ncbi:chemotaxis response regulator protein-glutamate methylesterase [Marinibaculum pumilum]|uniref:Protein-glutamate methylesterase/protein-glutamine glutaminase n=1 Tax=Marinibaculum pumilum TaxID=1766165 RepID=A0ABV7KZD9_9PROT
MLVDDSAVIRGLMARWMKDEAAVEVVASVGDGSQALRQVAQIRPEVMVLDIEMPVMDGLTALPQLLQAMPGLKVIMASTLTERNAEISLKALAAGAADYLTKPSSTRDAGTISDYQRDLLDKIKALGQATRASQPRRAFAPPGSATPAGRGAAPATARAAAPAADARGAPGTTSATAPARSRQGLYGGGPITLRQHRVTVPRVLAIGSSTGGPQALFTLFQDLKNDLKLPVLVTQHMPPTFTRILAEHLTRISGLNASEARDGEPLERGRIYVAPGDWHMVVAGGSSAPVLRLNQNPPENFCRPAVDPMFRSLAEQFGAAVLAVVLTGMGQDGLAGGRALAQQGATLLAQDEATSVVWGMPGAVASAGICSAVLPLPEIGPAVRKVMTGTKP